MAENRAVHNGLAFEDDIKELGLPRGIESHLRKAGLTTIRKLCTKTEEDILSVPYIGPQARLEIIFTLAHYDFRLGDPI